MENYYKICSVYNKNLLKQIDRELIFLYTKRPFKKQKIKLVFKFVPMIYDNYFLYLLD